MKARLPKGYGKQSPNEMMRQVQEMQEAVQQKQAELEEAEYKGTSGGGMVEVTMLGTYDVQAIKIDPEMVQPDDVEMLEDLVAAAFNDAVRAVKETSEKELADVSGQYDLPSIPGLL